MGFFGFLRRGRHERAGYDLYGAAVAAARNPYLYETLGAPDTLDGRFDLVGLHAILLIRRLRTVPEGQALGQAVFDAMFNDMDVNLREMGVSDLAVGRKVKEMWEAFHGRAAAYAPGLEAEDAALLAGALARNVWRGGPAEGAPALAILAIAQARHLGGQDPMALASGQATFLPAPAVA
jgi:cytochrome b pre-mRNA-processing protein 3